jgi:hypothetical protein
MSEAKEIVLIVVLLLMPVYVAANSYNQIILTYHDGDIATVNIEPDTRLRFDAENILLSSDIANLSFPISDVEKFTYGFSAGVEPIGRDDIGVSFSGNTLSLSNLPYGSTVAVYSLNGTLVKSLRCSETASINLEPLSPDIYLLRINSLTIKINR